ncbi:hypothetical protein LTR53_003727 [Teratosphaeriaceae sp. CCFEE 6253]|nr:hypothetical protein LTR53_003727 [Teratosphaeriaceae sp. CCFEE 6253]
MVVPYDRVAASSMLKETQIGRPPLRPGSNSLKLSQDTDTPLRVQFWPRCPTPHYWKSGPLVARENAHAYPSDEDTGGQLNFRAGEARKSADTFKLGLGSQQQAATIRYGGVGSVDAEMQNYHARASANAHLQPQGLIAHPMSG